MSDKRKDYDSRETKLKRYFAALELVRRQADDDALWFITENIEIAYLQQELRRLHAVIEGEE